MHRIKLHPRLNLKPLLWMVAFVLMVGLIPAQPVAAATYVVTSLADSGDGTCDATCTLREAITAANANAGADTITFSLIGTFTLLSDLPEIVDTLTISGNGTTNTIISGNNARRVLTQASSTLTLSNLTIRDGFTSEMGGGVYAGGILNATNVHFINNTALAGGALFTTVDTTIVNSVFYDNEGGQRGGAIQFAVGNGTVVNSLFHTNTALAFGAAINTTTSGAVTIINSTFANNISTINIGTVTTVNQRSLTCGIASSPTPKTEEVTASMLAARSTRKTA